MRITDSEPISMIFFSRSLARYLSFASHSAIFNSTNERKSLQVALITFDFMRNFQLNKSNEQTDRGNNIHTQEENEGKKNKKKPYIKTIRNEFEWKQIAFNVDCIDCVMQVWHEHTYIPTKQPKWKEVDEEDNET